MPEGLSASEVGKEIGEHAKHPNPHELRDRLISITEAVLLSVVALLAAWSGYAAAKWSTESRVELATASGLRIDDDRAKAAFLDGEKDGSTADKYVRLTVVLASILFLVGISTHFPYRGVRYGLVGIRGRQVVNRVARGDRHGVEPSDRGKPGRSRRP